MNVLIRGMKMPKNCAECPLCEWSNNYKCYVCFNGHKISEIFIDGKYAAYADMIRIKRADNCPMTELPAQHGRLIDGDIAEVITYTNESGDFADGILYAAGWIADQPTIIEAEGEDV